MLILAISVSICPRNASASSGVAPPVRKLLNKVSGLGLWHILGTCARVTVIGAGGAVRFEKCAPHPMRLKIALPVAGVAVCQGAQFFNIGYKAFKLWVHYIVRAVGCDHFARPSGLSGSFRASADHPTGFPLSIMASMLNLSNRALGRKSGRVRQLAM